jgi:Chaperone of endosialidase
MTISPPPRRRCRLLLAVAITAVFGGAAVDGQVLSPNLLFTSIQPCRVFDTRVHGDPLVAGAPRGFTVVGDSSDFANQGGHPGGCGIPGFLGGNPQVQAVIINLVAVTPASQGELMAWPSDQPEPLASILNFTPAEVALANGVVIPVRQDHEGGDITILAGGSGTHVLGDVLGYFSSGAPGMGNLSLGTGAGNQSASTGTLNTAIGDSALAANTTGQDNTAVGIQALEANAAASNNTALGAFALAATAAASNNTAAGYRALANLTTGISNTGFGLGTLVQLTTGSDNVAVGQNAGGNLISGTNNIYIGSGFASPAGEDNTIRIGEPGVHTGTVLAGVYGSTSSGGTPVYVNSAGQLGYTPSSIRFKEDVADMEDVGDTLMNLRPVSFRYKAAYDDGSRLLHYGLIAEEVATVNSSLVENDQEGRPLLVRYQFVNAMLLSAVQKQHRKMVEQEVRILELQRRIAAQQADLDGQKARIERLEAVVDHQSLPANAP